MSTEAPASISQWLSLLKCGEVEAAQKLWDRYRRRLVKLASRRLAGVSKRMADEEDVAQSIFFSLCRGAAAGRFNDVRDRDDLWWLLIAISRQKSVDLIRREMAQKRGAGRVRSQAALSNDGESESASALDQLIGTQPTPDVLAMLNEQSRRLFGLLADDRLRRIAASRIEGYTVGEIATDLSMSIRSVERKLQLIRSAWTKELFRANWISRHTR
jgi:RNA polymerase sigma factor (sigma-70 family)